MRDRLEKKARRTLPAWQRNDERMCQLALWNQYLDGSIYKCLHHEYDEEFRGNNSIYINTHDRKPSIRVGLAKMTASSIARKLFAGRHAPSLVLKDSPDVVKSIWKFLTQGCVVAKMLNLVRDGSVGAICATFKIVKVDDSQMLVMKVHKSLECFPKFDAADQLEKLLIAYETLGYEFINNYGITVDFKGEPVKAKEKYWFIRTLDKQAETHYMPVSYGEWNPITHFGDKKDQNGNPLQLVEVSEGELQPFVHGLGFVPGHWFVNGDFPHGDCLFDPALDNIVAYDYGKSHIDLAMKNNATPIVKITGNPISPTGDDGKPIVRITRVLQFAPTIRDPDGLSEEGGDADLLESNGQWAQAAEAHYRQVKKDAEQQIASSRVDPDKVTTAMSGKGMELVEEQFIDLVYELRTHYGDNGFLILVKKMCRAGVKVSHPMLKGVTEEKIEDLELAWPEMHDMNPQEQMQFVQALQQGLESGIIDDQQAQDMHRSKADVPALSHAHTKTTKKKTDRQSSTKKSEDKR